MTTGVLTQEEQENIKNFVRQKLDDKNIDYLTIEITGSRSGRYRHPPKETSDVDVCVLFPLTKHENGTERIKDIYNRLNISIHETHPWEYKNLKIDFIPCMVEKLEK